MRSSVASFDTQNASNDKHPVFAVEFDSINEKYVSGSFNDIGSPPMGVSYKQDIVNVLFTAPRIEMYNSQLTTGTYTVIIADKDGDFTSFLNTQSIFRVGVTIKIGFEEIDYADFTDLTPAGAIVERVNLDGDMLTWRVEIRDTFANILGLRGGVWESGTIATDTTLNGNHDAAVTTIQVDSVSGYPDQTDIQNGINVDDRAFLVVKIDSEIINYTVSDATPSPDELQNATRGVGNTTAAAHSTGATVIRGVGFKCDPLRTLLHILTTTGAGGNGDYDLTTSGVLTGFGIDEADINISHIEQLGWKMFDQQEYDTNGFIYIFRNEQRDVHKLTWIEDNLLAPFGLFLTINDGKLDVGHSDLLEFVENFSSDDDLDQNAILDLVSYEHMDDEVDDGLIYEYDYNHATGATADNSVAGYLSGGPQDNYGDKSRRITHTGLVASADNDQVTYMLAYRFLWYIEASTVLKLMSWYSTCLLESGDSSAVTITNMPNISTGSRGWSAVKGYVIGQQYDLANHRLVHEVRCPQVPSYSADAIGDYTVNKIAEGSIDDTSLAVSADESATTEAADAYYDNSVSAHAADRIIFKMKLTEPNFGGGSTFETIELKVSWLDSVPAIIVSDKRDYIHFNPQGSSIITFDLDLYGIDNPPGTPDRVKVDLVSTTATGSEVPTVEFIGVWFCVNDATI